MSAKQPRSLLDQAYERLEVMIGSMTPPATNSASSDRSTERKSASQGEAKEIDLVALGVELTLRMVIAITSGYALMRLTRKFLNPLLDDGTAEQQKRPTSVLYKRLQAILQKRGDYTSIKSLQLTPHERQMAQEILDPDEIESSFADIGGLDDTKRELYELAILPLVEPQLFANNKLVQPTKGILLYGKPGTGKTMLAKAIAKEARAVFLPLQLSKILNKWVGESNKLIAAAFELARKLQPSILFIDELDTFLKANTEETAYLDSIKAEFLTLWDGVATASSSRILVLGATNKPHHIDSAILRRMPRAFAVPLPDVRGRMQILFLLLKSEDNVHVSEEARAFIPHLARLTEGYSGSDLNELCKAAAMVAIQERTAEFSRHRVMGNGDSHGSRPAQSRISQTPIRPMSQGDLLVGLQKVQRTGKAAEIYGVQQRREQRTEAMDIDSASLHGLSQLLRSLSTYAGGNSDGEPDREEKDEEDVEDEIPDLSDRTRTQSARGP